MSNSESENNLRAWIFIILMVALTGLVVSRFADFQSLITTLIQGNWYWVLVGVAIHILYFYLDAVLHKYSFATVEVKSRASELFPVLLSAIAVNAVAPTGGTGGAALFVDYAVRKGQSGARTAVGLILGLMADLVTLIPFVLGGVFFLSSFRKLKFYETLGFLFFLVFICGMIGVLLLAYWKPNILQHLFNWLHRAANRVGSWFNHPNLLPEGWGAKNAAEFIDGARAIRNHPRDFAYTMAWGMAIHIVNLIGLYAFFLAYRQPVRLGTLVAGFSLGIVFFIVSVVPQGVGAVEGIMTLIFISMGIPRTNAIVISLAFRGVNFWLPLIAGFILLRKVTSPPERGSPIQSEPAEN
jgi:glycosyltransferase 2 family protein